MWKLAQLKRLALDGAQIGNGQIDSGQTIAIG